MTPAAAKPRWLHHRSALVTNVALAFFGAMLVVLSHHVAVEFDHFVIGYSETSLCALGVYLGAAALVLTQPIDRWTLPIILAVALLCRLVLLTPEPYLSSDIYRYVWDGIVQHHGVNPYRFVPGNPHLSALRDDDIFPNINRRDYAPTIYPPVAQIFFYLVTAVSPTLVMMKLAMTAVEGVTIYALIRLLEAMGLRRERVLLYAWSPLLLWEIGSSGHLDALVVTLIALAILFRFREQPLLTGLALGAAVMVKFYPLLLLPALFRKGEWRMPAALAAVVVCGYAIYSGAGRLVFGFAGGYVQEEGMSSGSRYFLLELARRIPGLSGLPTSAYLVFCAVCFLPLLLWSWRRAQQPGPAFLAPAAALALTLMLLFSPHYPWYVAWLVPFGTLLPTLPLAVYVYGVWYGFTTKWAEPGPKMFFLNQWVYAATALALLIHLVAGRVRNRLS